MKSRIHSLGVFLVLILVTFGCSDDPSDVGLGLLPSEDTLQIKTDTIFATSDTTFLFPINENSGRLLVGKFENLEARALMEFSYIPTFGDGVKIDSAVLTLSVNYHFKESSGEFGFTAFKMAHTWDEGTFRWDSLSGSYTDNVGMFFKYITTTDSTVSFQIDTALIREWAQTGSGSIALIPSTLRADIVVGFSNLLTIYADTRPTLTISYHDSTDTTITVTRRASRGISVTNGTFTQQPQRIYLQSGIAYRGLIRFDSLTIPQKVSITQANLEVVMDEDASLVNEYSRDSLIVYLLRKNVHPYDSLALGTICSPSITNTKKIFSADVKNIVQLWVSREPNYGFVLQTYGEFATLDRFVVFNAASPRTSRPKLTVTYTIFP